MSTYLLRVPKGAGVARFDTADQSIAFYDSVGEETSVCLSVTESKTLELLIDHAGEVVSREDILAYAWASKVVSGGSINQCIFSLRNTLGDDRLHETIQTVTRKGYKFNPDFLLEDEPKDETRPAVEDVEIDTPVSELANPAQIMSANINPASADQNLPSKRRPMASTNGAGRNSLLLWLFAGLVTLGIFVLHFEKIICYLDLLTEEFAPVKEYSIKGGRIIAFGFPAEDPILKEAASLLDKTDARPVRLVLHRWRKTMSVSCINSVHHAFNTRLPINGNSGYIIKEFIEHCRW